MPRSVDFYQLFSAHLHNFKMAAIIYMTKSQSFKVIYLQQLFGVHQTKPFRYFKMSGVSRICQNYLPFIERDGGYLLCLLSASLHAGLFHNFGTRLTS